MKTISTPQKYLNDYAKEQVKALEGLMASSPNQGKGDNKLFYLQDKYPGSVLFLLHLGLYGWSDHPEDLSKVIDFIETNPSASYEVIINFWGVEGCCVLGGIECSENDFTTIDTEPLYGPDPIPEEDLVRLQGLVLAKLIQ